MESQSLESIASELRKLWNAATEKGIALKEELATIEDETARIDAALSVLSGSAPKATSNAQNAKAPKRTTQTPSAKKADVIAVARRVLEKEEVMQADVLKKRVEDLLTESGFNRFGFAMRWKETVQDPQFIDTKEGMQLRDRAPGESELSLSHDDRTIRANRS
jgi:hypothetical protein